jgi:hypothetical protein
VTIVLFCIPTQTAEVVEGKWAGVYLQVISNSEFLNNIDSKTTSRKKNWQHSQKRLIFCEVRS